jgi:hypothetical protein
MKPPMTTAIAGGLWLLSAALTAATLWVDLAVRPGEVPYHSANTGLEDAPGVAVLLVNSTIGALIVSRQPRNMVGWFFLSFAILLASSDVPIQYAIYGTYVAPGTLPGTALLYRVGQALSTLPFVLLPFLMFLFPDGRFVSPGWRRIGLALAPLTLFPLITLFQTTTDDPNLPAPFDVPGADIVANVLSVVGAVGLFAAFLLGALSLALRYRRSRGKERLQMKWMVLACALVLASIPTLFLGFTVFLFAVGLLPSLAAGIAILRYRLYDIDLLINRTLVYGALTLVLAAVFFGGLVLVQFPVRALTNSSDVGVALSTLVTFALFQPLRARIQSAVDRRFYRHKYDAARTVADFSSRLRQQVDLEALQADVLGVVRETLRPASVSLWLRRPRG